jgi:alpha-1,3-mannosyltransferase
VEILASPSDEEIRAAMNHCSVIASASEYEGFGLAAVEGMSAGLFPVLSDIQPFRHLVERGGIGLSADFSDASAAADRFLTKWNEVAASYDDHRRAAMQATLEYRWDRVSERYEALYQSALGTKVRSILDVAVGVATFSEAAQLLDERFDRGDPAMVVFANAHTLNNTLTDETVRTALSKAIVFNDGIGVDVASRLLFGKRFPENMNGTDFIPRYLKNTKHRYRIFLLGAKPGIAERAAQQLARTDPRHEVAGCEHGYLSAADSAKVMEKIRRSKADILLVAMGDPKQELWLFDHLAETHCRLGFGVGGLFDFMAGAVPRAPAWVRSAHMEWLYRMLQEPQRLGHRYLIGMPLFLLRVAKQWVAGSRVPAAIRGPR